MSEQQGTTSGGLSEAEAAFWDAQESGALPRDRGGYVHEGFLAGYEAAAARVAAAVAEELTRLADEWDATWNRGHDRSRHPDSHLLRERAARTRAGGGER